MSRVIPMIMNVFCREKINYQKAQQQRIRLSPIAQVTSFKYRKYKIRIIKKFGYHDESKTPENKYNKNLDPHEYGFSISLAQNIAALAQSPPVAYSKSEFKVIVTDMKFLRVCIVIDHASRRFHPNSYLHLGQRTRKIKGARGGSIHVVV